MYNLPRYIYIYVCMGKKKIYIYIYIVAVPTRRNSCFHGLRDRDNRNNWITCVRLSLLYTYIHVYPK